METHVERIDVTDNGHGTRKSRYDFVVREQTGTQLHGDDGLQHVDQTGHDACTPAEVDFHVAGTGIPASRFADVKTVSLGNKISNVETPQQVGNQ